MGIVRTKDISICPVCKSPLCAMLNATILVLNVHNVSCIFVDLRGKVAAWNHFKLNQRSTIVVFCAIVHIDIAALGIKCRI